MHARDVHSDAMNRDVLIDCFPYLAAIAISVGVLRFLVWCSARDDSTIGRARWRRLWRLHGDEHGAVQSLSFVLTLPLFVMVMLFIVQLSQITIGRLVVEYAAFAAARSAIVWIPANTGDDFEGANQISTLVYGGRRDDENGEVYSTYYVLPGSQKFEKIRFAAAMALMPICPSRDVRASGSVSTASIENAYMALAPGERRNSRVPARLRNKLGYALDSTQIEILVQHPVDEPPLELHDIGRNEFAFNEIGWQDQLVVSVFHSFALLPGPGRLLARPAPRRDAQGTIFAQDNVARRIRRERGVYVYPLQATARLNNEGEQSAFPYLQPRLPSVPSFGTNL